MSKKELKDYYQWFMEALPKGINELAEAVRQTPGFETWQPDCTPSSLDKLGDGLPPMSRSENGQTRKWNKLRSV